MLRLLLIVACLVLASCASTDKHGYIRVSGTGSTFEQAKQNAFVKAVEISVGTVMVSERETHNRQLKNEVLAYSSGFVDDYKIVSTDTFGNTTHITLDVKVAEQRLANRILATGKSNINIDGPKHSMQYDGYLDVKQRGDQLLSMILKDYPKRAYNIKQDKYSVNVDIYRNMVLVIPYELVWNYNYIVSLNDALKILEDGSNGFMKPSIANVIVMAKDPKDYVIGEKNHYKFNDIARVDQIQNSFSNEPRILLIMYDNSNKPVLKQCWSSGGNIPFYEKNNSYGYNRNAIIYGNVKVKNNLTVSIPAGSYLHRVMHNAYRLELSVVSDDDCKNN